MSIAGWLFGTAIGLFGLWLCVIAWLAWAARNAPMDLDLWPPSGLD